MPGITPIADVPDAPTIGTATATGVTTATVAYTAAVTGGTSTYFIATSTPGSITGTSATSPITVSGLTGSTAYTFTVKGYNSTATGPASSSSNSITTDVPTSYESIATTTVGAGGSASITFSSIPAGYKHLQVRGFCYAGTTDFSVMCRLNGDTGSNYSTHALYSNTSNGTGNSNGGRIGYLQDNNSATYPNSFVLDILDIDNTNKYKTMRALTGGNSNGANITTIGIYSSAWFNTSAVTSLTIYSAVGGNGSSPSSNFREYSKFALYGIKG
jgi:hypothetical protein